MIERQIDGTELVIHTFVHRRDFSNSVAVDNVDGSTDVYFDRGNYCRGTDLGDISKFSASSAISDPLSNGSGRVHSWGRARPRRETVPASEGALGGPRASMDRASRG